MIRRSPTLGMLLRQLIEHLDGQLEQVYRSHGLGYRPRYTPLVRALVDLGPSSIRDLARHAGITHSAASQTVAQMAQDGLLKAEPGADARERVVRMTAGLRRMLPRLEAQWAATNRAAERLDEELPHSLLDVVSTAIRALERKPFGERIAEAAKAPDGKRRRSMRAGAGKHEI